ncbi:MAG: hypothetical protein WA460_09755 [Nitrososphaeraceae archaeon]
MKWRSVSSSANSMLIDLPLDMSTVAFTSFQASLPFVPRSKIPERETLLSELSWIGSSRPTG